MKTQEQAQEIFNILVTELESANGLNLFYAKRNLNNWDANLTIDTPLEHFLKSARERLTEENVSEAFLSQVYAEAFHTGPIPKNRNHIRMTCALQVNSGLRPPVLNFWVDLDKVAAQLNTHLRINPPYRFKVKYHSITSWQRWRAAASGDDVIETKSSAVNSVQNPLSMNSNFLIGCIVSGIVSVYALLITALAVASIITLSTAGIVTAAGVGLAAGAAASYCFFKARPGVNTTVAPIEECSSENIEDIFRNHFAAITILTQDRTEIIDDEQALSV